MSRVASAGLIVVDVQAGFDDAGYWGPRHNPDCERNVRRLLVAWRADGGRVVLVRHDSADPRSPWHPAQPGNTFKPGIRRVGPGDRHEPAQRVRHGRCDYGPATAGEPSIESRPPGD
jgi:nicotinamidase-related amidase